MVSELKNQQCIICLKNGLTLREQAVDVPHFGKMYIFSMQCDQCGYRKTDLQAAQEKEPAKYTLEVDGDKDLNIKIVKSGRATLKIPYVITVEPGPASEGYITNVEGVLQRVKHVIESKMEAEEDKDAKKKAKKLLKKINQALLGRDKIKIILEDPTGNSAIISEKAVKSKL